MLTLNVVGVPTAMVGLLRADAAIAIAAPILLVVLRILQGLSSGNEWLERR